MAKLKYEFEASYIRHAERDGGYAREETGCFEYEYEHIINEEDVREFYGKPVDNWEEEDYEEDIEFMDYLKEKYRDDAYEQFKEDYE